MVRVLIAGLVAMVLAIVIGPTFIEWLRRSGVGQQIREEGPARHIVKQGTPTMGGLLILATAVVPFLVLSLYTMPGLALLFLTLGCAAIGFTDDYLKVRKDIAAVKALMPKVFHDVAARALHLHGSLGATSEMPFVEQVIQSFHMGLADGPTEVHKITVARQVLREYQATADLFPTQHIPKLREAAIRKYAGRIEREVSMQS